MGLTPRTLKLMREAFKDDKCHLCDEQAVRMVAGKFYCHECFDTWSKRNDPPLTIHETRDNRPGHLKKMGGNYGR